MPAFDKQPYNNNKPDTTFVINSGEKLPVYNALKAGVEPVNKQGQQFVDQFLLSEPVVLDKNIDPYIYLPAYVHLKPGNRPLSIFNPEAGFFKQKKISTKPEKLNQTKDQKTSSERDYIFSSLSGGCIKKTEATGYESLRPVPLVKLPVHKQNYTQKINAFINYSPISKNQFKATDAMLGIVIGFVLFFLYMRTVFGRQIRFFMKSAFNRVRADNLLNESSIVVGRVSFLMNIFYFLTLGLLFTHGLDYLGINIMTYSQLTTFFVVSGIIVSLYLFKWLFAWVLAHILKVHTEVKSYFFHTFVYNKVYSIVVFPFLLAMPYLYTEWSIIILKCSLILLGIFYILRLFRNLTLSIQRNISLFYLFLYLCALEIIPILVMIKLAVDWLKLPIF